MVTAGFLSRFGAEIRLYRSAYALVSKNYVFPLFLMQAGCFNCALIDSIEGCRTPPSPKEKKDIVTFFFLEW